MSLAFPVDCHSNFERKKKDKLKMLGKTSVSLALLCFALSLSLSLSLSLLLIFPFVPKKNFNIEKIIHVVKVNKEMIKYHLQEDP
jgi:hypothetical protein